MSFFFIFMVSFSSLSQISTDIFEKEANLEKESFQDQVRIMRPFEGGWDISFEKRKGVYQTTNPSHHEILKESFDQKIAISVEVNPSLNSIISVKKTKPPKDKQPEN